MVSHATFQSGLSELMVAELGRGTSTYDGMAIAGAVLHHLATHTLPLGFFAVSDGCLRSLVWHVLIVSDSLRLAH